MISAPFVGYTATRTRRIYTRTRAHKQRISVELFALLMAVCIDLSLISNSDLRTLIQKMAAKILLRHKLSIHPLQIPSSSRTFSHPTTRVHPSIAYLFLLPSRLLMYNNMHLIASRYYKAHIFTPSNPPRADGPQSAVPRR